MAYHSSIVFIGSVALGGKNPVRIQSMTTTNTMDTAATVAQVKQLALAGCDFVRIATRNIKEAENLKKIKNELQKIGVDIPLIADVHFNPKVAETAARIVEKVRINPGNYIDLQTDGSQKNNQDIYGPESLTENLTPLLNICKQYNTAIRIGANHGSLSERILVKYGNTPLGIVESIMEFVQVCNRNGFEKLVLSLKASNVVTMIEANLLLIDRLLKNGLSYPIHLGVTEAGNGEEGRVKSAIGIGYLLAHGIGDTIRVSLTEDPLDEIPIAKKIIKLFGHRKDTTGSIKTDMIYLPRRGFSVKPPVVITSGYSSFSDLSVRKQKTDSQKPKQNCYSESSKKPQYFGKIHVGDLSLRSRTTKRGQSLEAKAVAVLPQSKEDLFLIQKFNYKGLSYEDLLVTAAVEISVIILKNEIEGIWIENSDEISSDNVAKLAFNILQALDLRITKTEFIACPTCGRSTINVMKQLETIKEKISNIPGLKIAVMGCAVNGPGEMTGANYGCVGTRKGMVNIYKGGNVVQRNIPEKLAGEAIVKLISESNDTKTESK